MSGLYFVVIPFTRPEAAQGALEEVGEGLGLGGCVIADLDVPGLDDAYARAARERDARERPA